MEPFEMIAWIALGFVPTFAAMEAAWRIDKRRLAPMEVRIRR
jgi:hypothetical protein